MGSWRNTVAMELSAFLEAVESHACQVEKKAGDRRHSKVVMEGKSTACLDFRPRHRATCFHMWEPEEEKRQDSKQTMDPVVGRTINQ